EQGKTVTPNDPFLGVGTTSVSDLDDASRQQYNVTVDSGAVVTEVVPGSAAAQAGVKVGDVIVKADGKAVSSSDDLRQAIQAKQPGDKLTLEIKRGNQDVSVDLTVGSRRQSS